MNSFHYADSSAAETLNPPRRSNPTSMKLKTLLILSICVASALGQTPSHPHSDFYLLFSAVTECVKEFNIDCTVSSIQVKEPTEKETYIQLALNQSIALKHCQSARSMLRPMLQVKDDKLKTSVEALDSSFAAREQLHKQMLEMIDRVTSGKGHISVSEVGKGGADAIEALNRFINGTTELFAQLLPSLPADERKLLAAQITTRFPAEQRTYDGGEGKSKLREEVWMIMNMRDVLLGK